MITGDLRRAIGRAVAGLGFRTADPGLRPAGPPGQYASSVAFALGGTHDTAARLAQALTAESWIAAAEVTGPGFLTITVTTEALAALPERVIAAGPGCVTSDALHGQTVDAPQDTDPLAAATWEEARKTLAAQLTVRLAAAAGATVALHDHEERVRLTPHARAPQPPQRQPPVTQGPPGAGPAPPGAEPAPSQAAGYFGIRPSGSGDGRARSASTAPEPAATPGRPDTEVARAVAFAGPDAVRFWLARAMPGRSARPDPAIMARHIPENPAYAVRYAHARAASGMRWAASRGTATPGTAAVPRCPPADPEELALLDALSWLPERVATAARRGRPDEFARYLEELARAVLAVLPGSDRLALVAAARTGLAAGLGLLGVSAPDRL